MTASLDNLPSELLNGIVSHINSARSLLTLSLTCKRIHKQIEENGFRVFVQCRFPSMQTAPYWKDAAHALTSLSRCWDRKDLVARCLRPQDTLALPLSMTPYRYQRSTQTMGFQPVIDCYEDWSGGNWTSRREVVAWGAGAELVIRARNMKEDMESRWPEERSETGKLRPIDYNGHGVQWMVYKDATAGLVDGTDDITSLNLLKISQRLNTNSISAIVGRASGGLEYISYSATEQGNFAGQIASFNTGNRPVRSTHIYGSEEPVLAACLSDGGLALYNTANRGANVTASSETTVLPEHSGSNTWSTRFLHQNTLAIGLGPSTTPIQIYSIEPSGISIDPIRTFHRKTDTSDPACDSVYPIMPLGSSSQAGGAEGDLFLSGWYSGEVRLHDLRCPDQYAQIYTDSTDPYSAVISLLPFGRERFVAGINRYSALKIFDLRLSGGKTYYADSGQHEAQASVLSSSLLTRQAFCTPTPLPSAAPPTVPRSETASPNPRPRNYNLYLDPSRSGRYKSCRNPRNSPIYSLAAASAFAPTFYVGLENNVVQIDVMDSMDRHPDPVFRSGWASGGVMWDHSQDVSRFGAGLFDLKLAEHVGIDEGICNARQRFRRGRGTEWEVM